MGGRRDPADEVSLILNSGKSIRLFTAKCYVGDGIVGDAPTPTAVDPVNGRESPTVGRDRWIGGWFGGSISLNGTGVTQAAPDFPLMLQTVTYNHSNGGMGVRSPILLMCHF